MQNINITTYLHYQVQVFPACLQQVRSSKTQRHGLMISSTITYFRLDPIRSYGVVASIFKICLSSNKQSGHHIESRVILNLQCSPGRAFTKGFITRSVEILIDGHPRKGDSGTSQSVCFTSVF